MTDPFDRRTFVAMGLAGGTALMASGGHAQQPVAPKAGVDGGTGIRGDKKTQVTMLVYPGTTMLDWVGPYEALQSVPGVEVVLAGKTTDIVKNDNGLIDYRANVPIDQIERTDVLLVPGGKQGVRNTYSDPVLVDWIKKIDRTTLYTVGICTGAMILCNIGLLKGRRATTYWAFTNMLAAGGATFVPERWVKDGKYWTSGGVSAGIDATLALIADLYGPKRAMMAQLAIEYDPHPPFNAGSVRTAPQEIIDAMPRPKPKAS